MATDYIHVDVFSARPYSGNSLAVFPNSAGLTADQMLRITQELRHFETVFFVPTGKASVVRARVFDLFEELPFAGHPLIGGAAVLHQQAGHAGPQIWTIELATKTVTVNTDRSEGGYYGLLDQGTPEVLAPMDRHDALPEAFGLSHSDLHPELPPQVVSTGLRYLIVPVASGVLGRARIRRDITPLLSSIGAQFAVLFDEAALEIRHWNNDGCVEDVATGSAAGTIGAYRLRHGLARGGETFILHQGQYVGRPSALRIQPEGTAESIRTVKVGGDVALVGRGTLDVLP
jgi:trans-2,3-dihydro-3-hydroxyanthranilate isomerase